MSTRQNGFTLVELLIVAGAQVVPIAWICGYASVPKGMTVRVKNGTTLSARMLPVDCRY